MTNKILNQLFSSCKKWKTLVLISMLLTLGVGQTWAKVVYYNDQGANGTPRVYYWNGSPSTSWDGCPSMVHISGNIYGYDIGTNTKCIFRYNNASSQTSDLSVPTDSRNYISTKTGTTWSTLSTYTASSTLYLLVNANWKQDGARFAACFLGINGQTWVDCSQVGTSDYYSVTIPSGEWPYVIFCRMNPTRTGDNNGNNWNSANKWNQTSDLAPSSGKNGVEITGWDNSSNWIVVYTGLSVSRTPTAAANAPTITNSQTVAKSTTSITVNAQNANPGYHFVNWTSSNGSFGTASNQSTTFTPSAQNATATANYAEDTYTVTVSNDGNGSTTPTGAQSNVGRFSGLPIDATANTNYEFVNWTITSGTGSFESDATSKSNRFYPTGAATIRANFRSTLTYSLTVNAGTGISSVTGSTDPVTLGNSYAISATPTSGYTFSTWTADPAANGTFANANTASTNVTVKNGSVTVTGAATENMTTVTVNVNPTSAGTLTVGGSAFTPGSTTTAGVATSRTVVATPASGKVFLDWSVSGNATGTSSINTYTLKGNGSSGTGTLTANFGIASGWYMEGQDFGGWGGSGCSSLPTTYQFARPYRGMENFYYMPVTLEANHYFKVHNGDGCSNVYNFGSSSADVTLTKGTIYNLVTDADHSGKVTSKQTNKWAVINTTVGNKQFWFQDPQTFYNVNVTNEGNGSKGTYKVTLNSTSAFTKGANVFETTQFANGEGVKITVTGVDGYIPTITIGANVFTFWKQATSYEATFTMGSDDVNVTISYTAAYAVTFATTTGCAMLSALGPAAATVTTGDKVKSGTTIDFSQTASPGYDFTKWYSTSTGSGGTEWGTESSLSKSITSATSVYPIYTAHTYTGGVLDKKEGSANGSYSVTYLSTSFASKEAPTRTGYNVEGYYKETERTTKVANADGSLNASKTYTNSSKQWTYTSSIPTLYSKWTAKTYTAANNLNRTTGSAHGKYTATYDATTIVINTTPTKTGYHVEGYYRAYSSGTWTEKIADASGNLQKSTTYTTSANTWKNDGNVTLYTKWTANTYSVQFDPNDDQYAGDPASGTMSDESFTYGVSKALTANGFTREGYTFAGWATSPTGAKVYNDAQSVSNLTSTNEETVTLYAKWTGTTYTVTFNARGGSDLSINSKSVTMGSAYGELATITPPAGKVFTGWYTSSVGGTQVTAETLVATPSDHTLYAHYAEKAQVYFKNTLGWSKVFVTYDAYWDNNNGTGNYGKIYHEMQLVSGTEDVFYDDIPDAILSSWKGSIAFNSQQLDGGVGVPTDAGNYGNYNKGEVVYRMDFDSKATMFVPTSNKGSTADGNYTKFGAQYRSTGYKEGTSDNPEYTSGYWRTFNDTYSGYTMTYQKDGGSWSSGHRMECSKVGDNTFIYTINMDANSQYNFAFYKECPNSNNKSRMFNYRTQITSSACTDLKLVCNPNNAWMQTTAAGDYVFKLEMKNDGHMYLTVEYPFKANDYKVVYSYTKDGAKTYDSEIIRGRANGVDTISVFIHSSADASSRSLKIAQCTGINASGVPTWNNSYATIDISSVSESGVYDFIITQSGSAAASGAYWNKYSGNYYIRTAASDGGWDMYKYRPDNIMTLSEYSLTQTLSEPYSHYYCRFIESTTMDITYAVATDYSPNISGIMVGDATIGGDGNKTLPASANVRFTYNEKTNALRRAYLKNAQGAGNTRFLVLHGKDGKIYNADGTAIVADPSQQLEANELLFLDLGNWVYQVELEAQPFAAVSLIANYNGQDRYLIGGADSYMQIMGGDGSEQYDILAVYDFKTNRLMTVWIPGENITESLQDVDVLLIRHGQEAGRTIVFGTGGALKTNKVIGAIEFRYNELVGYVANWNQASREKLMFDVSFPFDVNVSDIFGLNAAYGEAYAVQKYNGEERASKGFFQGDGTTTFWQTLSPSDVMKANVGYTIITDNDYFNNDVGHLWDNKSAGSKIYLYFPSASNVGDITSETQKITVPEHKCTIDRTFTGSNGRTMNHKYTDSNWNMMGVPVFANVTGNASGSEYDPGRVFLTSGAPGEENTFHYFYKWNTGTNGYDITAGNGYQFKSMHSYMVQYTGQVWFTGTAPAPVSAVAARSLKDENHYVINMQMLDEAEEVVTRTYVELRENACDTFALNEDVCMIPGEGDASIYSFAGNYDVAANVLPIANQVVVLGVEVNKAGKYTFSMPSIFSGKVTLIDNYTGEHVDLSMDDYEVELEKGIISDRFMLEINIEKVTTAIDGANDGATLKDGKAHKFLQNGILYILQNGILYDAQGKRVQ